MIGAGAPLPATGSRPWTAFVDESFRTVADPPLALLSGVVVHREQAAAVRQALAHLVLGSTRRLHWRNENARRRSEICSVIAASDVRSETWWLAMPTANKQERARRLLLERALFSLSQAAVDDVLVETRHAERDLHDAEVIMALRHQGSVDGRMIIHHGRPGDEPLLWLPDAIAGAVGESLLGHGEYARRLGARSTATEVPWR